MDRIGGSSTTVLVVVPMVAAAVIATQMWMSNGFTIAFWLLVTAAAALGATLGVHLHTRARNEVGKIAVYGRLAHVAESLARAGNEDSIASITARETSEILETERVAYVPVNDGHLIIDRSSGRLVIDPGREQSVVGDIAVRGEIVNTLTHGGVTARSEAVLGVPIVSDDEVVAVIVAVRDANRPFTLTEQHVIAQLSPTIAAALDQMRGRRALAQVSDRDSLTGLSSRSKFDRDLAEAAAERTQGSSAIALVDIDHFHRIIDRHGQTTGDHVLAEVADILRSQVRGVDGIYRFERDEFCLLLSDIRGDHAVNVLDRIRAAMHHVVIPAPIVGADIQVTVSIGVAFVYASDPLRALRIADDALTEAKNSGHDRVVLGADSPFAPGPSIRSGDTRTGD